MRIVPDRTELQRVRALCLALPEVTERLSHGSPTWFVRGKNDPREETTFFIFFFFFFFFFFLGHRGWVGVHLNRGLDWNEIAGAIEEAYLQIAPRRLAEEAIRARG